jgi:hypothetical protein
MHRTGCALGERHQLVSLFRSAGIDVRSARPTQSAETPVDEPKDKGSIVSSKRVAAGLIAASLVGSILAQTSAVLAAGTGQSGGVTIRERAVARGVIYRRIVDPAGPWVIHELEVDPMESLSFDTLAAGRMGTWARTSTMAASAGRWPGSTATSRCGRAGRCTRSPMTQG